MSSTLAMNYTNVMRHAENLATQFPDRFAGTDNAARAARYIAEEAQRGGIPCRLEEFEMYVSVPVQSSLTVLAPTPLQLESVPFANTPSTRNGGLEAEIVFVGDGGEADFAKVDVNNKFVLAESSYSPPRQEKIRLAELNGAVGILVMHWGDPDSPLMVRGNAKAVWGNPTIDSMERLPKIPAVGISRRDGSSLINLLGEGRSVRINLEAESQQYWGVGHLPIIKIEGRGEPEQVVVVGGHYDSWAGGATDNAVGDGFMLELARTLWERRTELERSVWIAFWPGHETATMTGSTWFVDSFWDELADGGVVYINVDTLGLAGSDQFLAHCSVELRDFARGVAERTLTESIKVAPLARTGDQSFFGVGIPSIYGRTSHDEETVKQSHGATLGWWNHSHPSQDNMDKVDPELVEKAGRVIERWVWELANQPVLPFRFSPVAQHLEARLVELAQHAPDALKLVKVRDMAATFSKQISLFEARQQEWARLDPDRVRKVNASYLRLCRCLTPVLHSVAGRYGQDAYGLSALKTWLPGLYPLDKYTDEPDGGPQGAVLTTLLRERNRARDGLRAAINEVQALLQD